MTTYCAPCISDLALLREAVTAVGGTASCAAHAVLLTHPHDVPGRRRARLGQLRNLAESKAATAPVEEQPGLELLVHEYTLAGAMDMTGQPRPDGTPRERERGHGGQSAQQGGGHQVGGHQSGGHQGGPQGAGGPQGPGEGRGKRRRGGRGGGERPPTTPAEVGTPSGPGLGQGHSTAVDGPGGPDASASGETGFEIASDLGSSTPGTAGQPSGSAASGTDSTPAPSGSPSAGAASTGVPASSGGSTAAAGLDSAPASSGAEGTATTSAPGSAPTSPDAAGSAAAPAPAAVPSPGSGAGDSAAPAAPAPDASRADAPGGDPATT